jgi:hypothetical protein
MIWWDPGNAAGFDIGNDVLKNLAPTGTTWDAPKNLLLAGAGASATLDASGRYIEYVKTGGGCVSYFAPNTVQFQPGNQAFTWISWYAVLSNNGSFVNIFPYQNTSGTSYIRARGDSSIWQTNSNTAGQDNWTFTPPTLTWYMMAITSPSAGGSAANPVDRSAYYNGVLDTVQSGTVTTLGLAAGYGFGHGDRASTNRTTTVRAGMTAFYLRELSGAEILDIYNTYRPFYPESI